MPGQINALQSNRTAGPILGKEHQDTAVRRPGRPFLKITAGKNALAINTVNRFRIHHSDTELPVNHFCKSNIVAARRPYRRCIAPGIKTDAMNIGTVSVHNIKLLIASAVGVKHYLRTVGRIAWRRIDRPAGSQLLAAPAT